MAPSPEFTKAAEDVKKLTSKPSNDDLLEFYALYKIGTGADFSAAKKPGMFDLTGKAKHGAWEKKLKEGLTPEEAQTAYIKAVEEAKTKYGYDENKVPE